ncbi:hypothetical protein [Nonomuraea endophytica]|uniref:hypothetical protein n=1 Tax=Nonomuraea endophytica TaxID=714136 RepID=UPI0037C682C8
MNEHMITDYVRTRHADLIAEAATERTATTHHRTTTPGSPRGGSQTRPTTPGSTTPGPTTPGPTTPGPTAPGPTASGAGHSLRHRAARVLHTLANAIDPHPTPH